MLNEKLRAQGKKILLEYQSGFRKGRSCIDPLFSMKLRIEKRRELNLETHLVFMCKPLAMLKARKYLW
jgi:hypothetical protein